MDGVVLYFAEYLQTLLTSEIGKEWFVCCLYLCTDLCETAKDP